MYKIRVDAMICEKGIRDFVAGACGQDIAHIGTPYSFVITTGTKPDYDYLIALQKHIESATPEDLGYNADGKWSDGDGMKRYFIDVKASIVTYEVRQMEELKPCPFCGNQNIAITNAADIEECANFERCEPCNMLVALCSLGRKGCGTTSGYYNTREETIAAWNTRA